MGWQRLAFLATLLLAGCVDYSTPDEGAALQPGAEAMTCREKPAGCEQIEEQVAASRRQNLLRNTFLEFDRFQLRL